MVKHKNGSKLNGVRPNSVDEAMPWTVVKLPPKPKRKRKKFRVPSRSQQVKNLEKACRWQYKQEPKGTESGYVENHCRYYQRRHANLLYAVNPYARKLWASYLLDAFKDCEADDRSWMAVTVFSEEWDFEEFEADEPEKTLGAFLKNQGRIMRNRFRRCDFIFFAELGIHRLPGQHRYRYCRHFHGLVLGDEAKLEAIAEGFGPGFAGAPGCKIKPLNENKGGLRGWLRYITKDPRAQYVTFTNRNGKVIHKAEQMTAANQSATIEFYGDFAKPELAIASGLGAKINSRTHALAKAKGYREYDGERAEANAERPSQAPSLEQRDDEPRIVVYDDVFKLD